jgi:predicted outer membrane protein
MTVHTRRAALAALATAAAATPLLVATHSALAQTAPAAPADPQAYKDYVTKTLQIGGLSLQASQLALQQAQNDMVKQFAQLEADEQTAVATVLSSTGAQPPAPSADDQAKLQDLQSKQGADFDTAYIQAQIDGHNQLLQVQQTISGGLDATVEVITAKLAVTEINSHLAMLNWLQQQMGGGGGGAAPASAETTTTTTTTEGNAAPATPQATTTTTTEGGGAAAPATPQATTTTTTAAPAAETAAPTTTTSAPATANTATTTTTTAQ